jgi:hypothetical protein
MEIVRHELINEIERDALRRCVWSRQRTSTTFYGN